MKKAKTIVELLADYALKKDLSAAEAMPKLAEELAEDFCPNVELSDKDYKLLVNLYCELLVYHIPDADKIVRNENESAREFAEARREGLRNA